MYGLWIFAIVAAILMGVALFFRLASSKFYSYYKGKLKYTKANGYTTEYYGREYDQTLPPDLDRNQMDKWLKKKEFWSNRDDASETYTILIVISAFVLVIFMLCAIFIPLECQAAAARWTEFAPMVEQLINSGSDLSNIAITPKIIEYNDWLASARASQNTYGIFSPYYNIDLSHLEYIRVGQ